jgi:hypothetical protein
LTLDCEAKPHSKIFNYVKKEKSTIYTKQKANKGKLKKKEGSQSL